ncbi:metallophosphoesterase [Hamadaea sp. NPDC051192]|uniref:metallophosphoesterase family protein n=1 Tax=Hamadaea sp. NPDC051192 TaxID=3154940 RepID=UPI0034290140
MPSPHLRRRRGGAAALAALLTIAGLVLAAEPTAARRASGPDTVAEIAEPSDQTPQIAEAGAVTHRLALSGRAGATAQSVCQDGAAWLRLRFTELTLRGGDTITLTGQDGRSLTLGARSWPGRAFHTRAFAGGCVRVAPALRDPTSRYAVDAVQSGSQSLAAATVTVAAAGDICGTACNQTDDLVAAMNPTAVITMGDQAYESGTLSEYNTNYNPTWGQFKAITYPVPGNHEYNTSGAAGYFDYFNGAGNQTGRAGDRSKGYYSFDVGDWHFVALNSNISTAAGSAQEQWLRTDLAATTKPCTAAFWHHPRFAKGNYGDNTAVRPLFQALYDNRADLVLNGHDHNYVRYAMSRPDGVKDTVNGVRELLIGTGGRALYTSTSTTSATVEASNNATFGVGRLTLTATGYTAAFVPVAGRTYTDSVTGTCKKAAATPDFAVTANPASLTLTRGASTSTTVSVSSTGGFSAATALSVSGLPTGVTASFSPSSVTPPANGAATATLTLTASSAATTGSATLTVSGVSGATTRSATLPLTVSASSTTVFSDDFETDKGWTVNPSGTDTATAGLIERGVAEQTTSTYSNQIKQLGTPTSGTGCLVTGRLAGSSYGANDLDGGVTSIRSPLITLPAGSSTLSLKYNLAHGDNSSADDYLRVSVVDGTTVTVVVQRLGSATEVAGAWQTATADLSAYAGRSIRLLVSVADAGTGSLLEAQVDDIAIAGS